ncbi:MAG: hypothetical protein DSZ06_02830 [Sulfurospirillum sp.]|nr:MAG: hypothetical protein DSZ06_02830 [Sulfurospirillum sp.]
MNKFYFVIFTLVATLFYGCGRAATESDAQGLTTSSYPSGGKVDFDIISKSNTLLDKEGNYKDAGHYSILFQAKVHKNGMPLSGLNHDEFYTMSENGIYTEESKLHVSQEGKIVTNKVLLLLDFSGSIVSDCNEVNASKDSSNLCYQIVNASKSFIDTIVLANQKMSIYYFNSQRKPLPLSDNAFPTDNTQLLKDSLNKLYDASWRKKYLEGYNSTNLYGAIKVAADEVVCDWFQDCIPKVKSQILTKDKKNYDFATIVVFTDGKHTVGDNVSLNELLSDLSLYKRNYYYTIGLGKDVEDDVLKQIGKDGYLKADQTEKLYQKFGELGEKLNHFANSFYRLDFCPAQQDGVLDLRVDVDDRGRKFYGTIEEKIHLINGIDFRCDIP